MKLSCYDYCLTILSYNPKTIAMMRTTLLSKGYTLIEIDYTIDKLIKEDYLNDRKFCEAYFNSEVINKGKSKRAIKKKLFQKGMPSDIIDDVLEEMDEELDEANIPNLARDIQKLHKQGHDIIKIYEKLARKGHRYDDIKAALEYIKEQKEK